MTTLQKVIKYAAVAFAIFLIVSIVGGIFSAASVLAFFDETAPLLELKTYPVNGTVQSIVIELGAADLTIQSGTDFSVQSNHPHLSVTETVDRLIVKEKRSTFGTHTRGARVIVTVPSETLFEHAAITTGAGRVTADTLAADTVRLELGAGEVKIDTLCAIAGADIDGGAGKFTVGGGEIANLDLDMGVGEVNLTAALTGHSELDQGIGAAHITLLGDKDAYRIELDKGVGKATVDGEERQSGVFGGGAQDVEISGGVGEITVAFGAAVAQ